MNYVHIFFSVSNDNEEEEIMMEVTKLDTNKTEKQHQRISNYDESADNYDDDDDDDFKEVKSNLEPKYQRYAKWRI